jgi:hypothetical protein
MKHFRKFKNACNNENTKFYEWLSENTEYVSDIDLLVNIIRMFDLETNHTKLESFKNIKIINGPVRQEEIENIMKDEDFIFCKSQY